MSLSQSKFKVDVTFFVYVDYTAEPTPRPFYVGKGDCHRLRLMKRNAQHERVAATFGINRVVVFSTLNEAEAFEVEAQKISQLHTHVKDPLSQPVASNFTLGGNGARGIHTVETFVRCPGGEVIKFPSVAAAARFAHVDSGVVSRIITGRGRVSTTANGFGFFTIEDRPRKREQNRRRVNCKVVIERDEFGTFIVEHESIGDAASASGVSRSVMSRAIRQGRLIGGHTFTT